MRLSREVEAWGRRKGGEGGDRRRGPALPERQERCEGQKKRLRQHRADGERSGRIEITSATEREREREWREQELNVRERERVRGVRGRQRYAERGGTRPDRTRRVVARAHKLKPAPRVVIAASLPTHPPASLAHPSALRYVALCDVRLTNPTPPPRRSFVRSVGRSVPPPRPLARYCL